MKDVEFEGAITPWLRFCIGSAVLMGGVSLMLLAAAPFVHAIRWW
ncbi:hypothetical protein [Candidatus Methylospira mobilis]|nr:hypothetical protein [Candidatus Methylospira mobilis]